MKDRHHPPLTIGQILLFLALILFFAWLADSGLTLLQMGKLRPLLITTGAYGVAVIVPLAYLFSPQLFTEKHWQVPRSAWKAVCSVAAIQFFLNYLPNQGPLTKYVAVGALFFGPPLEELIRAVVVCPLSRRLGAGPAILVTSFLFAIAHPYPVRAMVIQTALTFVFVTVEESVSVAAIAHFAANAIVVLHCGITSS